MNPVNIDKINKDCYHSNVIIPVMVLEIKVR